MSYSFRFYIPSRIHGWTYQGLDLPSRIDTAGHTMAFIYRVTQTRLDIPMPLFTQSHRHGWTFTEAFIYPVTQTRLNIPRPLFTQSQIRLDIPRPLFTQSHSHGWTYQGLYLPSHTDTVDIPWPLFTQSHRHGWTYHGHF